MNIKKILLILICLFIFSGCSIENISNNDILKNVDTIFQKKVNSTNTNAIGYQYYLPGYMTIKNVNDFNQELYFNGNTFYLYADVVSYYNKVSSEYKVNKDSYISKKLKYGDKEGYLEINKDNEKYYVEMMFNYAKMEGYSSKNNLIDVVNSFSYVLSSIKYNDNVISTMIGDKKYDLGDNEIYNIFSTKKKNESNFLDYINEYDNYDNKEELNNLIEKEEITSDDKED